jgi:hypothetical protein
MRAQKSQNSLTIGFNFLLETYFYLKCATSSTSYPAMDSQRFQQVDNAVRSPHNVFNTTEDAAPAGQAINHTGVKGV